jgi:hypothetical protein
VAGAGIEPRVGWVRSRGFTVDHAEQRNVGFCFKYMLVSFIKIYMSSD